MDCRSSSLSFLLLSSNCSVNSDSKDEEFVNKSVPIQDQHKSERDAGQLVRTKYKITQQLVLFQLVLFDTTLVLNTNPLPRAGSNYSRQ